MTEICACPECWCFLLSCCERNLPMCCSMKVLSVRGTLILPTLVCPLLRMSSRTDFKLGNLFRTSVYFKICNKQTSNFNPLMYIHDSPPGNVGLHDLHHGYRVFVDFHEGPTEDLPQPQHLDYFHHFGTDTFNPNNR